MVLIGNWWNFMVLIRYSVVLCGTLWYFGMLWCVVVLCGMLWPFLVYFGIFFASAGYYMLTQATTGYYMQHKSTTGYYRLLKLQLFIVSF